MHRLEKNILHHARKQREQRKLNQFKLFEGFDHYNNKPLYQVIGINNDYEGEWHTNEKDALNELNELNNITISIKELKGWQKWFEEGSIEDYENELIEFENVERELTEKEKFDLKWTIKEVYDKLKEDNII